MAKLSSTILVRPGHKVFRRLHSDHAYTGSAQSPLTPVASPDFATGADSLAPMLRLPPAADSASGSNEWFQRGCESTPAGSFFVQVAKGKMWLAGSLNDLLNDPADERIMTALEV
jgi:hypothetical protein